MRRVAFGYPVTPYLPEDDREALLAACSVVTEKLDGVNVGVRADPETGLQMVVKDRLPEPPERAVLEPLGAHMAPLIMGRRVSVFGELTPGPGPVVGRWHIFDVVDENTNSFWPTPDGEAGSLDRSGRT